MMSDWKVELVNDNINELYVEFKGPKESELHYHAHLAFGDDKPRCRSCCNAGVRQVRLS